MMRINIALCFDRSFMFPSAVTILSVLKNGSLNNNYHFYIVAEKNTELDDELFCALKAQYPNFSYEYREFSETDFFDSYLPEGVPSRLTFARLYLPEILYDLDYCIYLDGDLLVLDDFAGMLSYTVLEKFDKYYLAAAPDYNLQAMQGRFFETHRKILEMKDVSKYFNAGVMIMNLKKMREDNILKKSFACADKGFLFADQDILNTVCIGKTIALPVCWNVNPTNLYDKELLEKITNNKDCEDLKKRRIKIIHFAGPDKPWKNIETEWENLWADYADLLPDTEIAVKYKSEIAYKRLNKSVTELSFSDIGKYILYGFTYDSRVLVTRLYKANQSLPTCFIDNDPKKQGRDYMNIPCVSFAKAKAFMDKNTNFIICAQKSWKEIRMNLLSAGVDNSQIVRFRLRDRKLISYEKTYGIGLLMGVFDLFHVGHLNLIRRAKAQCCFLRIGVLADKLVHEYKQIYPTIPQDERMEILCALRDVDEVVLLETKEEVSRLHEWHKRPFDCFFSGDDYADNAYWAWEKKELKKLGADMVFFPYTKKRSSSMIRKELQEKGKEKGK